MYTTVLERTLLILKNSNRCFVWSEKSIKWRRFLVTFLDIALFENTDINIRLTTSIFVENKTPLFQNTFFKANQNYGKNLSKALFW